RERIRARWKVVLIDESQDNSPIQFEIFRQLFGPPGKRWLFFIGDPKQAIYSFRGADLQQWRQIANPPPDQPPPFKTELTENWRSCNEQIQAVNQVFGRAREQGGQSFVQSAQSVQSEGDQSDLHYAPSKPATQVDPARLISHALEEQHSGTGSAPKNGLEVLTLAIPEATKGIDAVRKYFARVCAAEVAALIQTERQTESQNQTLIKDRNQTQTRPLVPRDIAILVPENKHSLLVQQALMEHGIHSSLRNTESVLRSQEAFWLWHLLRALETPDRPETVAAAIATPLMAPPQNLTEQNQASERLIHYAHKWQRHGIYVTLMALFKEERISHRLIGQPQGARTLTNLLHLSDILQQQQQELLTRSALVQWLENALASDSDTKQDARMRLESDEHLVSIMTIHSSKGLEFPLVYMPFVWDYTVKRQSDALIKTRDDQLRPALYLPDPQHPPSAAELQKQHAISTTANTDERIRLLYVAMTRALCRTSLLWPHELPSKKPPPYIQNILGTAADWQSSLKAWGKLAANSAGCIWIKQLSDADSVWSSRKTHRPAHEPQKQSGTSGGQARSLGKKYPPSLFVTSFSQIKSELDQKARAQQNHYADNEDTHLKLDPMEQLQAGHMRSSTDWHAHSELLDFPGGTQTGLFFHHALECIIEQHLTACNAQDIEHMIQQMQLCERYQLPPDAAVIAASALHQLLHLTLEPAPVCLADLPPDHTASELEFDLPLSPDWHRKLHALNLLSGNLSPLGRTGGRHYMKGFIDLTIVHNNRYYLADLKTNWLGDDIAHYQTENLAQTAQQQHYDMQLNLYGLALHRHLQLRLPDYDYDRHFGGSFLLFIRGLNPKQEGSQGIWFHRLEKQRMLDLDNAIGRDIPPAITHD
ncbi:MAG: UvrD-helicase domain-containing protein, partial [Gammaproteobacteria bacterium]